MKPKGSLRCYGDAVAIVSGGASGIGRAISEELARRSCEVVIADRQAELAEEIATNLRQSGRKATAAAIDVTNYPAMEKLVQGTIRRTGRLDYMFNNAGIGIGGYVDHFGIEDWNYIVAVNLNGVINGVQAVYRVMAIQGFGHIVNTASMAGLSPYPGGVAYAATKHAVVGLSQSLRGEAARFGIRVSVLCPGVVRTPILAGGGRFGRLLVPISRELIARGWERFKPMPPELFAQRALNAVAGNKAIIIEPPGWRWFWRLGRLSPSLCMALARKNFQADLRAFSGRKEGGSRGAS